MNAIAAGLAMSVVVLVSGCSRTPDPAASPHGLAPRRGVPRNRLASRSPLND
jgi:hypothetical protein